MRYEITIYNKFGIKSYDMEEDSDELIKAFFTGRIDHFRYRERITIYNKDTNHVEWLQNF